MLFYIRNFTDFPQQHNEVEYEDQRGQAALPRSHSK